VITLRDVACLKNEGGSSLSAGRRTMPGNKMSFARSCSVERCSRSIAGSDAIFLAADSAKMQHPSSGFCASEPVKIMSRRTGGAQGSSLSWRVARNSSSAVRHFPRTHSMSGWSSAMLLTSSIDTSLDDLEHWMLKAVR